MSENQTKKVKVNEQDVNVETKPVEEIVAERDELLKAYQELQTRFNRLAELYTTVVDKFISA